MPKQLYGNAYVLIFLFMFMMSELHNTKDLNVSKCSYIFAHGTAIILNINMN